MDKPFPIVGVGASAGGVEALEYLFKAMPLEPGMAFVCRAPFSIFGQPGLFDDARTVSQRDLSGGLSR